MLPEPIQSKPVHMRCSCSLQVWQDLFAAARAAQSNEFLDALACRQPPVTAAAKDSRRSAETAAACSSSSSSPARVPEEGEEDPTLGICQATAFSSYLSPEALVQRHRLGKPDVRRLYQALQVRIGRWHWVLAAGDKRDADCASGLAWRSSHLAAILKYWRRA